MSDNNHSFGKEHAWYPWNVSDRTNELINELEGIQRRKLFDALSAKTLSEWFVWLEEARVEIGEYDYLKRTERKRRLRKADTSETLLLHHACVFVELWRIRTQIDYFHFPPHGLPIDTPESQREMMLAVLASYSAFDDRDLWPFEFPDGEDQLPFRKP